MKERSSRESKRDKKIEIDEDIIYEKLLFIGDKKVGKLSLIQNLFSQDSNIIISENVNNNNINIENSIDKNKEVNENNNNPNKEEKKEPEKKEENDNNNNTDNNNNSIKKEEKDETKDKVDNDNKNDNTEKKEVQFIIYEKKMSMKNSTDTMKYFQIFITSFCDNNLIHSLGFMCQCILVLFNVKNKISFENAKKIISIIDTELKNDKIKVILVSTKNDQDTQDKEIGKEYINNEEVNNFLDFIIENNNKENKHGILLNKYIEISNNTKRGINNLRTEILNSYDKNEILHAPLKLGLNPDFFKLKSDDIYDKFNTISTNDKSIKNNNNNSINNQESIIETISPKYIFKLENIKPFNKTVEDDIYENIKIILLGDTQVGKTSFLNQFFSEGFNPNLTSTIGITERSKILCYNNKNYKIQIWDTAGQERFESIPKQYYEKIEGVFLFYDVTNEKSFENIIKWLKDILEGGHKDLIVYILGNKVDLIDDRKVSYETGLSFAKNKQIKFMEISCKLDLNIRDVVYCMIYDIFKIENNCADFNPTKSFSLYKSSFDNKASKTNSKRNISTTNSKKSHYINEKNNRNNSNSNEQNGCCF